MKWSLTAAAAISDIAGREAIFLSDGDLPRIVDQIERLLVERDPRVVQRDRALYVQLPDGLVPATAMLLRLRAMQFADFYKTAGPPNYNCEAVDPLLKLFQALLHKGEWKFPRLDDADASSVR